MAKAQEKKKELAKKIKSVDVTEHAEKSMKGISSFLKRK